MELLLTNAARRIAAASSVSAWPSFWPGLGVLMPHSTALFEAH